MFLFIIYLDLGVDALVMGRKDHHIICSLLGIQVLGIVVIDRGPPREIVVDEVGLGDEDEEVAVKLTPADPRPVCQLDEDVLPVNDDLHNGPGQVERGGGGAGSAVWWFPVISVINSSDCLLVSPSMLI